MEEPTVICTNCERPIPESKSFLHEAYCLRNIIRCPKCNEPIDKNEVDEHNNEMHKMTSCKHCKKEMESKLLSKHEETCTKKPKMCPFCNCEVGGEEYSNHTYQCGSRTKKCIYCNKNILIRDYDDHEIVCQVNQSTQNYSENFPKISEERKQDPQIQTNPYQGLSSKYVSSTTKNPYEVLSRDNKNKDPVDTMKTSKQTKDITTSAPTKLSVPLKQESSRHTNLHTETKSSSSHQTPSSTNSQITNYKIGTNGESVSNKYGDLEHKNSSKPITSSNNLKYSTPDYLSSNYTAIQNRGHSKLENHNRIDNQNIAYPRHSNVSNPTASHYEKSSNLENQKNESRNVPSSNFKYGAPTSSKPDYKDYLNRVPTSHKSDIQTNTKAEPLSHTKLDTSNYPKKNIAEDNYRHGMPIYHQHNILDRASNIGIHNKSNPSSGLSSQTKPEPKYSAHQDLYNKKPSSIHDKNELGIKQTKDMSRGLNQDYKTGITNEYLRKNPDYLKRDDETKNMSRLPGSKPNQPSSYKYPESQNLKSRDLPKDYSKKETTPNYKPSSGITSNTGHKPHRSDLKQKPSYNIPNENPHPSKLTRDAQHGYGSYDHFEQDLHEDPELQKVIQESLKESKKVSHDKHHQNKNRVNIQEEMQIGEFADDPELQRIIQESLKDSGKQSHSRDLGFNDTMNDESFKRILERSKYEK